MWSGTSQHNGIVAKISSTLIACQGWATGRSKITCHHHPTLILSCHKALELPFSLLLDFPVLWAILPQRRCLVGEIVVFRFDGFPKRRRRKEALNRSGNKNRQHNIRLWRAIQQ